LNVTPLPASIYDFESLALTGNYLYTESNRHLPRKTMTAPTVFISYSHKDEEWKDRLVTHLRVLQMQDMPDVWTLAIFLE
jgi:hypothetical protein